MTTETDTRDLLNIMCDESKDTVVRLHAARQLVAMNDPRMVYDYLGVDEKLLLGFKKYAGGVVDPDVRRQLAAAIEWLTTQCAQRRGNQP
ncbi:hypothetical protein [Pseudomonas kurunegalensis]|uniref:hypothetical protein n=1 Tax=Pseudomonas kurunegalensis TaxID=485880 RepID=UPI0023639AED|nr:hypothetical protein [Pseudomonas kurunegalensis]MDD2135658.1 hypothetical protein [Pseudomonas kurunegalensis]